MEHQEEIISQQQERRAAKVAAVEHFESVVNVHTPNRNIFVDPDKQPIEIGPWTLGDPEESLRRQMEKQVPGSFDAMKKALPDGDVAEFAKHLRQQGPAALGTPFEVCNGEKVIVCTKHDVVVLPSDQWDNLKDVANTWFPEPIFDDENRRNFIANFDGDINRFLEIVAKHESNHVTKNQKSTTSYKFDSFKEEIEGDIAGLKGVDPKLRQDFIDMRNVVSICDTVHAGGMLIQNGEEPTPFHLRAVENMNRDIASALSTKDDKPLEAYVRDVEGQMDLNALFVLQKIKENPEVAFAKINEHYVHEAALMRHRLESMPGDGRVLVHAKELEHEINYARNFEDGYRRLMMGQNVPVRENVKILNATQDQQLHDYCDRLLKKSNSYSVDTPNTPLSDATRLDVQTTNGNSPVSLAVVSASQIHLAQSGGGSVPLTDVLDKGVESPSVNVPLVSPGRMG